MALRSELKKALRRILELEQRLGRNSRNSHLPPSKDPPHAPPTHTKEATGRKPGGQPGHPGTNRELLPIEKVDHVVPHIPTTCETCRKPLRKVARSEDPAPIRHQVFELPEKLYEVTEHQGQARVCDHCGNVTRAEIPVEVSGSIFGPRMAATAAFMVASCHASRRQTEEMFEEVIGVPIALGTISNLEAEVSEALEAPYEEARAAVREAEVKNVDETGWKRRGKTRWLWTAATAFVAVFMITRSRGTEGLWALLGRKLCGIFTTDRWSAYLVLCKRCRQICWAHLLRDFQKLVDRGGAGAQIGRRAKDIAGCFFTVWWDFKTGAIDRETLQFALRADQRDFKRLMKKGARLRDTKAAAFCQNLLALESALWTFLRVDGVEPTNNHAERVLRRGVLWRKNAFGSWSDDGMQFVERSLTAIQSLRLQKRPVLDFLVRAIDAHRKGREAPSLLPA